ncbi:MAG: hypothetical protein IPH52_22910 [Leptospiraceae bacterium]|nr:hypothetical protein [Leptospiraceae bacterium]
MSTFCAVVDKILIRDENNEEHPLILNFWDMGGQKLYHATHRFFFSEKALYLLVWDKVTSEKAKNNPENGIDFLYDYWLDMAHNLGKASPVIMVQSQVEKPEQIIYPDDLNQLKEEYNVLDSLHLGAQTPFRLDRVESAIKEAFRENEKLSNSVKICLPESWFYLKKELQAFAKSGIHYISLEKFIEHCKRNKISESAHGTLLKYLHDIGSVLYFGDLEQLKDMVIINPLWIINIVYKILDRELEWRKGQFDKAYIREKLKPKEKEDLDLSDKEIDKFLEMLIKFEVCFKEPGSEDKYIASQFLTKERIIGLDQLWKEKSLLFLKYPKYINENIMIRLISRFGEKADLKNYWNNGILFTSHHSQSLIEAFHNLKEIQISFTENHSELFHEVVKSLREVHRNIGVNLYIRCLCSKCQTSNEPNQFLYEQLIEELDRGKQIQCPKSHELVNRSNYSIYLPIKKEDIVSDKDISIQSQIHKEIYEETKLVTKEKKPNKKSKSKKKILFISFQSIETKKINAEDECNFIKNLLNTKPSFTLIDELSTPKDKLAIFLKKYQPDILHITSHSDSEKGLLATDKLKKEVEIPPEKLARIINDTNKLNKHTMELVILNACNSAEHAKILSRAETINCAIGINNFILDGDAIKFTELFYESFIIENNSFEVALEMGNIEIESEENKRYILYNKENNK